MDVRPATAGDEAAIVEMAAVAVPETFPHLNFSPTRTRESFRRSLADQAPVYFVVETPARQVVGFQVVAWGNSDFSTALVVEQRVIFVRPEFRGSDAAASLIRHLVQWAERLGADEMYVNVASGRRQQSTARYIRRFGFTDVGSVLRKTRQP
ncbi:GNAT family N-acetyltransferase [Methylobacterium sp. Leaf87]|uniref:GNAT family N-acetyltransferase n=1 Tax=Methylobacterium sp. Leaf87 TaxID=1736243 RepID=UPI000AD2EA21|nr:GNAT family N-acetyltransferase [Methylobacterium sp. Leaf87]